jgi:hypothetical protein
MIITKWWYYTFHATKNHDLQKKLRILHFALTLEIIVLKKIEDIASLEQ